MIKVIASDMDGTLLGDNHKVAPETVEAIREAQAAGIRFMIATGRSYNGAMEELKDLDLGCDFIVGSGAEVRNPKGEILKSIGFTYEVCNEVAKVLEEYPISVLYCAGPYEYRVGTPEEVEESIVRQIQLFHLSECRDQIEQSELYKRVKASSRRIDSVDELEKQGIIKNYRARVDRHKLGYHITAFINLEMNPNQKPEFYPFIKAERNVLECNCVTGEYSMLLKVAFPSTMDLDEFIGRLQTFGKTSTQIVFSTPVEPRGVPIPSSF